MNIKEIAALAHSQAFPKNGARAAIDIVEFERTAISEWAYQTLLMAWKEKAEEGYFEVPSYLLAEVEKDVVENEMDISDLKYFKSLPTELWLQQIGENDCECRYIKSTLNLTQLLCDDDSLSDADRTYFPLGKKLKFPKGVHKTPLKIVYATMGSDEHGIIEVSEAIGALIRQRLNEMYIGKRMPVDVTNNNNENV